MCERGKDSSMTLNVKRLDDNFAFEIVGLNLWADLDDETFEELSKAWSTQGVLVFRRQCLSEDELLRVSARFGEPDVIVRTDWASTKIGRAWGRGWVSTGRSRW